MASFMPLESEKEFCIDWEVSNGSFDKYDNYIDPENVSRASHVCSNFTWLRG